MSRVTLVCLVLAVSLYGVVQTQSIGRVRIPIAVQPPYNAPCSSCAYNAPCGTDLTTVVQLAKALNEVEGCSSKSKSTVDSDEMVMKLINALIYATVGSVDSGSSSSKPLINLDLLDKNGLAKLDVANLLNLGIA